MSMNHGLLTEKWRPTVLEDYVGNDTLKTQLQKFIDDKNIPHLLFYGSSGTGKTTLAKLLVKNLDCDYLFINASDENGIDTIRDKVKSFASSASFKPIKIIILDESEFISIQGQGSLRNVIETFSKDTRFILTCNYVERIIDPIQSRCTVLKVLPPSKKEVAIRLDHILTQEDIKYETEDLKFIIEKFYPDLRKMINSIQISNNEGKLKLDKSLLISTDYISPIIKELNNSKPNINTIHQLLLDSGIDDFDDVYLNLFNRISEYSGRYEGSIIYSINEHMYKSNFKINKLINLLACLSKIIEIKSKINK